MSDTESHEFVPPEREDGYDDIIEDECQSCGEASTGNNLVPCPQCGGDWCFDCFEEHISDNPTHIQPEGGEIDADDRRTSGEHQEADDLGLRLSDAREDSIPD